MNRLLALLLICMCLLGMTASLLEESIFPGAKESVEDECTERYCKGVVELVGGEYIGIQEDAKGVPAYIMFNDPMTKSTIMVSIMASEKEIRAKLENIRLPFNIVKLPEDFRDAMEDRFRDNAQIAEITSTVLYGIETGVNLREEDPERWKLALLAFENKHLKGDGWYCERPSPQYHEMPEAEVIARILLIVARYQGYEVTKGCAYGDIKRMARQCGMSVIERYFGDISLDTNPRVFYDRAAACVKYLVTGVDYNRKLRDMDFNRLMLFRGCA